MGQILPRTLPLEFLADLEPFPKEPRNPELFCVLSLELGKKRCQLKHLLARA